MSLCLAIPLFSILSSPSLIIWAQQEDDDGYCGGDGIGPIGFSHCWAFLDHWFGLYCLHRFHSLRCCVLHQRQKCLLNLQFHVLHFVKLKFEFWVKNSVWSWFEQHCLQPQIIYVKKKSRLFFLNFHWLVLILFLLVSC